MKSWGGKAIAFIIAIVAMALFGFIFLRDVKIMNEPQDYTTSSQPAQEQQVNSQN